MGGAPGILGGVTDPRSARQVAKRLGISRSQLQIMEAQALRAMALAVGAEPPPMAPWIAKLLERKTARRQWCSKCHQPGHQRRTCIASAFRPFKTEGIR